MARFYRVVTEAEWEQIQATGAIEPSSAEWTPYPRGTVFFVFEDSVPMKQIEACAAERSRSDKQISVLIAFDVDDLSNFERDRSGWSVIGGVAHRGTLRAEKTRNGFGCVCRFD